MGIDTVTIAADRLEARAIVKYLLLHLTCGHVEISQYDLRKTVLYDLDTQRNQEGDCVVEIRLSVESELSL